MSLAQHRGGGIIILSILLALLLTIFPLPEWARWFHPEWVSMVLIYWCIALPMRVGVGIGWSLGLLLDVMLDSLLGQHALTLALIAFIANKLHQRIRIFPLWQQSLTVLVLLIMQAIINLWIKGISSQAPELWSYLIPTAVSAALWPGVYLALRYVRRAYRVS